MMEGMPAGTSSLVDQAIEETPQTLFSVAEVPLARTQELLAAITGAAVRSVLEARIEQIVKHGHSAENDDLLPIGWLPRDARDTIVSAIDLINADRERQNPKVARRRLVKAAAILLAAVDRLDRAQRT